MITILISPRFRKNDLRNIFSNREKYGRIIYLLGIKNSRLLFNLYLNIINILLIFYRKEINLWISDVYIHYINTSKFCKIDRKKIYYFSMNAEFDILENGSHEIKKNNYLLFKNEEWGFIDKYQIKKIKKNIQPNKIIYFFGELNLNKSSIIDPELMNYYDAYITEKETSDLIDSIDKKLISLYRNRNFGDLNYYNQLIPLRNAQRFYYLRLISNNFREIYFMGDDLSKYGISSYPSSYSYVLIYENIKKSYINLDLGSKSFVEKNYPRSLLIKSINQDSLFQLSQDEFSKNNDENIFTNKDIIYKLKYKLNKNQKL